MPIYRLIPTVKQPEKQRTLNERLITSALVLVLFFIMGTIPVIGLTASNAGYLEQLQMILASNI
jgi:preprotein translocase subunit SecY